MSDDSENSSNISSPSVSDVKDTLSSPMNSGFLESKNVIAGLIGLGVVFLVFIVSVFCIFHKPDIASSIVNLATTCVTCLSAVTTSLIIGHSAISLSANNSLSNVRQAELKNDTETHASNNADTTIEKVEKIVQTGSKYLNKNK